MTYEKHTKHTDMISTVQREDTVQASARKIFEHFEVGQSCTITGFVIMPDDSIDEKGKLVCDELIRLDFVENFNRSGSTRGNGMRRRRIRPENSIGDYLRKKTFQWQRKIIDNQVRYTIWRIQ